MVSTKLSDYHNSLIAGSTLLGYRDAWKIFKLRPDHCLFLCGVLKCMQREGRAYNNTKQICHHYQPNPAEYSKSFAIFNVLKDRGFLEGKPGYNNKGILWGLSPDGWQAINLIEQELKHQTTAATA